MVLGTIYVVRHGFRSNWVVDPATGEYFSNVPSPTGITADPALAGYGVQQAKELGKYLGALSPPVDLIYSSPFYRCIQTLLPFTDDLAARREVVINVEPGVGEFFGRARFDHPSPASLEELNKHFHHLKGPDPAPTVVPSKKGETTTQLHDRVAYCLQRLIERADADPTQPKSLLICTHAAVMICLGRVLTGRMPADECEDDFQCFTCSFSKYERKPASGSKAASTITPWSPDSPDHIPDVDWRGGQGVGGGWECKVNSDCSFLTGGEERGWRFSGDEGFLTDPNAFNDSINLQNAKQQAQTMKRLVEKGVGNRGGKSRI